MPDISNVDSEKILSAVSQLEGVVDRINGCVGKFADAIGTLDKGWASEVKASFMDNYQVDWDAMQEMIAQLREINEGLKETASDFDKAENEILADINSLGAVG
ncbi:MAG: WXG100 family type VII secretion target [Acidobacteriota bacterium]|jgi:WXG100 family type VII secretion target|nr:WXG100 family type VII secretion target [Acidobacteriota bacterium]